MKSLPSETIKCRYDRFKHTLNECSRRLWAGAEALELGYGGIQAVARATGLAPNTIAKAVAQIKEQERSGSTSGQIDGAPASSAGGASAANPKLRKAGGGRKQLTKKDASLEQALDLLIEPYTSGDPMRNLRWTCKSTAVLARELTNLGHPISPDSVGRLLKAKDYRLQSNRKRFEGKQHPQRNAQFEYVAKMTEEFQARGCPVISVDTKKKELIGNYQNAGREWLPKGTAIEVEAYDFIDEELGKAIPYGIYDTAQNQGWVNVGNDHDTAEFAVASIRRWWEELGEWMYPQAREIMIMADGGGSNGSRNRLWKKCLQEWANQEGLKIMICHFPPGTSKWNKIEHRMFCHITRNWRGKPLLSLQVIIELISATTTAKGLKIGASLDKDFYPTGKKVTDEEMALIKIDRADFQGDWNYLISPIS